MGVLYWQGAGKAEGMGDIALTRSLDRLPWINRLPEGPTDLLGTDRKHIAGLNQMV